jgi:ABC-type sugar transport system ATPase subunit
MARVELVDLKKSFGSTEVIRDSTFVMEHGEFVVLVGPSGCGKSTLLRCISGLEKVSSGKIIVDGEDMTHAEPAKRGIAMVFQSYALYPHMTVAQNIGFGLKIAGEPRDKIVSRVREVAALLKLDTLLQRKPSALSGGQRQRVAIGRALARNPRIFLFDEPLSNLDASLRGEMRVELARLHARLGNTMVYVTHDQVEAMTLADRIVVMRLGVVEQIGTPLELFNRPVNKFVAGFLGQPSMNFVALGATRREGDQVVAALPGGGEARVRLAAGAQLEPGAMELGVRPEDVTVKDGGELALLVDVVEQLGDETIIYGRLSDDRQFVVRQPGQQTGHKSGDRLRCSLPGERVHLFDASERNVSLAS